MSRIIKVAGVDYNVVVWTGGDTPDSYIPFHAFIRLRGELYREQWRDYVTYWYEAPGPDVRATFWRRAAFDAWRTLTEHDRRTRDDRMMLDEWAKGWPYVIRDHVTGLRWTPDSVADDVYRAKAWRLKDYRVSSVTGGSIWFKAR